MVLTGRPTSLGLRRRGADGVAHVKARAGARVARGRHHASCPLRVDASDDEASDVAVDLREALGVGVPGGVHLAGQGALWAGLQDVSKQDLEKAEPTGFPIVLLILLGVFGSLAAAALPLALGVVSVLVTGALIYFRRARWTCRSS